MNTPTPILTRCVRRRTLIERMGNGVAIIPSAPEQLRNRDTHFPYRQDSYFWYLSAFPEPEAVIVLIGGNEAKSILFCRTKDPERETWNGYRYGPDAARETFGFDEAYAIDELEMRLPDLISNREALWHAFGSDATWDARISAALNSVRRQARSGKKAPGIIRDFRIELDRMRQIKDEQERETMRRAGAIASAGHRRAMRACRPGMSEYQIEAELSHEFRLSGTSGHAYPPIVAGAASSCILHYIENSRILQADTLILVDAGCELDGYASDITRTFPVSGSFTPSQRDVYEIVLAAQKAAIEAIRPGVPFNAYHEAALRILVQGLIDLGLLQGTLDGLIESQAYTPYYMHRAGHWLGLDVHDAGEYKEGDDWVMLQPGMCLTVEPGLYIRPGEGIPEALHNIGIRIEDDVFVTDSGVEVYTTAPKTIVEIEETMRRA